MAGQERPAETGPFANACATREQSPWKGSKLKGFRLAVIRDRPWRAAKSDERLVGVTSKIVRQRRSAWEYRKVELKSDDIAGSPKPKQVIPADRRRL